MSGNIADRPRWRPLHDIDPHRLSEARLQAHYAVQWLARWARAYVPPQPDDAHTNLGWDNTVDAFVTHPLPDGARLSLQLADLTLVLHEGDGLAQSVALDGRSDMQVRQWLAEWLAARGRDTSALDAPAPYSIPPHAIAQGAAYDVTGSYHGLTELAAWYANADLLLGKVQRHMSERESAASPVRCWPHHFDFATLVTLPNPKPEQTAYVGAGLSPGDDYYDEPYFYVSIYPKPDAAALPSLPALGHWHSRDFTAIVAPAHRIVTVNDQSAETDDFLRHAVDIAIKLLS